MRRLVAVFALVLVAGVALAATHRWTKQCGLSGVCSDTAICPDDSIAGKKVGEYTDEDDGKKYATYKHY